MHDARLDPHFALEEWRWSSYRGMVGLEKPHLCLTKDWVLGQFSDRRRVAERKFRDFVIAGITGKRIWKELKGQCILGKEEFVDGLINYVKGYADIKEIPKSQRYVSRPKLDVLLGDAINKKHKARERIKEAIEKYGYSQKEVADYLNVHCCTVSRVVNK